MSRFFYIAALVLAWTSTPAWSDEVILQDGGVEMTRDELEYIVRHWTPEMQAAAASNPGDRLELLNLALASKKMARDADKLTVADGDLYWKKELMTRKVKRDFMVEQYLRSVEIPDMTEVARERYLARKDYYARVPEQRLSSHILIKCDRKAGCLPAEAEQKAERILAKLEAGEAFEDLAREYSEDKRSAAAGGRYDRWLTRRNKEVAPEYTRAVFELERPGDRTDVFPSRFGYHIIRLDEIRPERYMSFEEAKGPIIAELEQEYKKLNAQAFDAKYRISDEARISGPAMDALFEPYRQEPAPAAKP
jgi:parvulin-like peptidyl-prolyl isomerase